MARTGDARSRGVSCLLADASTPGLTAAAPEHKMGLTGSPTAQLLLDQARVPVRRRVGAEGDGLKFALDALNSGRLGIAARAGGPAPAARDEGGAGGVQRAQVGPPI